MADTASLLEVLADAHAKMELLWLRANEEGDDLAAQTLERVDPGLVDRLRASGADLDPRPGEEREERRARFARLWDECLARHARRLAGA